MAPSPAGVHIDSKLNSKYTALLRSAKWQDMAAGVTGGVVSTLVLHPLDLIKIRFQVNEGPSVAAERPQYKGIKNAFATIRQQEGFKGLYRGVTPNVWGAGSSWGLYFLFYNAFKTRKQEKREFVDKTAPLAATQHMLAAAQAGVCTLVITNPVWVAKTRLCLQYDSPRIATAATHYTGMLDCLVKITKYEGFRGLYKGFLPGVFGVSHGALQFVAYEELKKMYNQHRERPQNSKFNTLEYLSFAALSKIFAASITYPYQVVRSRLQDQHRQYAGAMDVMRQILRYEGLPGFYKGLRPYLLHVTPNICIVFLIYEKVVAHWWFGDEADSGSCPEQLQLQLQLEKKAAAAAAKSSDSRASDVDAIYIDSAAEICTGTVVHADHDHATAMQHLGGGAAMGNKHS